MDFFIPMPKKGYKATNTWKKSMENLLGAHNGTKQPQAL